VIPSRYSVIAEGCSWWDRSRIVCKQDGLPIDMRDLDMD
jgi:hypothetical protein